ncbi:MAG: hypothetical protein ACRDIX_09385 [Actinomycetota bacterium]
MIENLARLIVHSVLEAQIGPNWWSIAVAPRIQTKAEERVATYARRPWYSSPGTHDIYFTFLSELVEIMRANANLFVKVIPDIDQWIARLELVRVPRNVAGHMNWVSKIDRKRVDVTYSDMCALVGHLAGAGVAILIPQAAARREA